MSFVGQQTAAKLTPTTASPAVTMGTPTTASPAVTVDTPTINHGEDTVAVKIIRHAEMELKKSTRQGLRQVFRRPPKHLHQIGGSDFEEPEEFDVNVKLADLQADPNNPLFSVKSFDSLVYARSFYKACTRGFHKTTKVWKRALPLMTMNPPRNLIGQSQSGTGKTAAFVLNMVSRISGPTDQPPQYTCAICEDDVEGSERGGRHMYDQARQATPRPAMYRHGLWWGCSERCVRGGADTGLNAAVVTADMI